MSRTLLIALAVTMALPAAAAELAGVAMDDSVTIGDRTLVLNGLGLRKKYFFKVYVAGLYLPEKTSDARSVLAMDGPRHMVMQFVRSVGKDKICNGWREGLEANTPGASESLKQAFETLCSYMEDVKSGDRFVFTYLPDKGTEVRVKGRLKGTIPGKEFARALFACWIGDTPPGEAFKAGLLGG